jgi:hypothetical protein
MSPMVTVLSVFFFPSLAIVWAVIRIPSLFSTNL